MIHDSAQPVRESCEASISIMNHAPFTLISVSSESIAGAGYSCPSIRLRPKGAAQDSAAELAAVGAHAAADPPVRPRALHLVRRSLGIRVTLVTRVGRPSLSGRNLPRRRALLRCRCSIDSAGPCLGLGLSWAVWPGLGRESLGRDRSPPVSLWIATDGRRRRSPQTEI